MRFRIQTDDGRSLTWEQDGPAVFSRRGEADALVHPAELFLSESEAQELCMELAYQTMRARHPERNLPE